MKKTINDKIIIDITTLFEEGEEEEDNYEPKRISNFWNYRYIGYQSNSHKNRNLSLDEYLHKIKHYSRNTIINLQNSDPWKIQLTIAINVIFSKDADEEHVMHSNSSNIKFTPFSDTNDVIDLLFKSLYLLYEENLKTSMKGSDFIFDPVQLLYYKCHKVIFNRGGLYIDFPDWIKEEKATINPKNTDKIFFQ